MNEHQIHVGLAVAPGIAVGPAVVLRRDEQTIPLRTIDESDIDTQIQLLDRSITNTRRDIEGHRKKAMASLGEIVARIFDAHLLIIEDEPTFDGIRELITSEKISADYAVWNTLSNIANSFASQKDILFRERAQDVRDVCRRLVGYLSGNPTETNIGVTEPSILITAELSPSDVLRLDPEQIRGIITGAGGSTSHTAILTRTLGVPSVVGLRGIMDGIHQGDTIVVNGNSGKVILNPTESELEKYRHKEKQYHEFIASLKDIQAKPAKTIDGHTVDLAGNIELPDEAKRALKMGGNGVGLFRTEYLFLASGGQPSEEEQYEHYKRTAEILTPKHLIIRTFDLGGDKAFPGFGIRSENNPFMGWRAIRIGLDRPDMLKKQLRAILRASVVGNIRIMFPMISGLKELIRARSILNDTMNQLENEEIPFDKNIPVGIMVEVPSVAIIAERFAPHADFFSIGTNDLAQFTLAVDRDNEQVAHLHTPFHPSVLRLIHGTVQAGHNQGIKVGLCGEFSSDPLATMLLIGLGVDELSTSPGLIPEVKKIIRSCSYDESKELAERVLELSTAEEVRETLLQEMKLRFADLPIWFGDKGQ